MNRSSFKKWFIIVAAVMLFTVLQTGAGVILSINSIAPDLLFAFAVAFACVEKKWHNVLCAALICGIFSDFVCHSQFAGYTAVYSYSAVITYLLKNLLLKPGVFFVGTLALVVFIAGRMLLFPVYYFIKDISFAEYFLNYSLPMAVYNTVCFFVIYLLMRTIQKRGVKRNAAEI